MCHTQRTIFKFLSQIWSKMIVLTIYIWFKNKRYYVVFYWILLFMNQAGPIPCKDMQTTSPHYPQKWSNFQRNVLKRIKNQYSNFYSMSYGQFFSQFSNCFYLNNQPKVLRKKVGSKGAQCSKKDFLFRSFFLCELF